jgi:amino acid permease
MKEPHKFPRALSGVMLFVSLLFAGAGAMGYMAYGSKVQTVVLVNLPQDNKFVQAVQFLCTFCWRRYPSFFILDWVVTAVKAESASS